MEKILGCVELSPNLVLQFIVASRDTVKVHEHCGGKQRLVLVLSSVHYSNMHVALALIRVHACNVF
jgi:hypothetical protein